MTANNQTPVFVAMDGGSGNISMRFTNDRGEVINIITPSLVRRGRLQHGMNESTSTWKTQSGELFSVTDDGTSMELVNTCDPEYQLSDANRVLVLNAVAQAGLGGRPVVIGDTLPAVQYYGGNGIDTARIEAKRRNLMQPITNYSGELKAPIVKKVLVFPEAVTAYVSASTLPDGSEHPEFEGVKRSIIIDLGRFTCDIAIVNEHLKVLSCKTTEHGIHVMIDRLHLLLQEHAEEIGLTNAHEIQKSALDEIIRQGYIGSRAESRKHLRRDITKYVEQAAMELATQIREDIRSVLHNMLSIDMLLFVGGGANWLGGKLSYLPNLAEAWHDFVFVPDHPELAVTDGVHILMEQRKPQILQELAMTELTPEA
ncbi:ParM/StbA family protein [Nissabacter sp. SGAir0207]|uniref:ParM/StbA family protein n=1 Tax=Nissabacter sp. SGAir0207 TaxID=2126321 RepID=UPI0010CCEF17|nr:ParM/StbA family protein [Nissabacter sp. SGAir0207]QCR38770.1 hypothetical protein C1N62_21830 [Nissabacter sp. SGAir0207]